MPMNPLDLRGPQFLLFYLAFGACVLVALALLRRFLEPGAWGESLESLRRALWLGLRGGEDRFRAGTDLGDPYLVACLRGGANESLKVAAVSLVDRGLIEVGDDGRFSATAGAREQVKRPIETAILSVFQTPKSSSELFQDAGALAAARDYEAALAERGLMPDTFVKRARFTLWLLGAGPLWGLAASKIAVAISRGRGNVGFLFLLAILFAVLAWVATHPRRTRRGDRFLADLRKLFSGLSQRANSLVAGGGTAEAVLLAAVFGLALLPNDGFAYTRKLMPASAPGGANTGTSCGTSGGSSCGSSCGGSCGGGCGGCGS